MFSIYAPNAERVHEWGRLRRESHKARQEGDKLICLEGDETNKGASRNHCNFLQRGEGVNGISVIQIKRCRDALWGGQVTDN